MSATKDGDELVVQADGQERKLPRNVWTTSYWHAPEDHLLGQNVSLLDSHKGRSLSAKLERVGEEPIALGDKDETCSHYRLARRRRSRSLVRRRGTARATRSDRVGSSHPAATGRDQAVAAVEKCRRGIFQPRQVRSTVPHRLAK